MSLFIKQSHLNSWCLILVVMVIAIVCHMRSPYSFTNDQRIGSPQTPVSRTQVQKANLEAAVSGSIGIDKSRGDSVSVVIVNTDQ